MSTKKKQPPVEFTPEELDSIRDIVDYNLEILGENVSNWGYKHPGDIQAWGQDITKYGMILEKITKLKGKK